MTESAFFFSTLKFHCSWARIAHTSSNKLFHRFLCPPPPHLRLLISVALGLCYHFCYRRSLRQSFNPSLGRADGRSFPTDMVQELRLPPHGCKQLISFEMALMWIPQNAIHVLHKLGWASQSYQKGSMSGIGKEQKAFIEKDFNHELPWYVVSPEFHSWSLEMNRNNYAALTAVTLLKKKTLKLTICYILVSNHKKVQMFQMSTDFFPYAQFTIWRERNAASLALLLENNYWSMSHVKSQNKLFIPNFEYLSE